MILYYQLNLIADYQEIFNTSTCPLHIMNDAIFRAALKQKFLRVYGVQSDTVLLEELGLWHGETRVDVAIVNGLLHGFEIKSDKDTLARLKQQVVIYNSALDYATLVVGQRHLECALDIIPEWWGVEVACQMTDDTVTFDTLRVPQYNPRLDPLCVAQLLWRDETLEFLEEFGAAKGYRSKSRHILHQRLVEVAELDEIRDRVRHHLKTRTDWKVVSLLQSNGD